MMLIHRASADRGRTTAAGVGSNAWRMREFVESGTSLLPSLSSLPQNGSGSKFHLEFDLPALIALELSADADFGGQSFHRSVDAGSESKIR
jgi:hypothetical protein